MSNLFTTALSHQTAGEYEVLRAAELDVWVAFDGGSVIVMQGAGDRAGDDTGASSGDLSSPIGVLSPDETATTLTVITDGSNASPTVGARLPTSPTTAPSSVDLSTITPSAELSGLMSESQAPNTMSLSPGSGALSSTLSNVMTSLSTSDSLSTSINSMPATASSSTSAAAVSVSAEPTTPMTSPPTPAPLDYLSHSPPFYVAIVLGSIAGVAVLAALISWAFRRQAHEKRRRLADEAARLPWISPTPEPDDRGFSSAPVALDVETGMQCSNTEVGIMNLGREGMAHVQAWEPRGDRDVGEPKRSECYDRKQRPPFITQQIPSYTLFSRYSGQNFINRPAASPCANRVSLGSIDPHLQVETLGKGSALLVTNQVPSDLSMCSSQEAGFSCLSHGSSSHPEIGTPRELVPMPRFLGLDGKGLDIPWEEKALPASQSPVARTPRSRIMSAEHIRKTWDRQAPKTPEDDQSAAGKKMLQEPEVEGWANSMRSNFINAFNAVAASLPISAIREGTEDADKLTPARPRRSSKRKALQNTSPTPDGVISKASPSRGCTIKSSSSNPWSLVETGSNTGIVHIRVPASDTRSVVSNHEILDPGFGISRSYTLHSHEPLRVKKSSVPLLSQQTYTSNKPSMSCASTTRSLSATGSVSPKRPRKTTSSITKRRTTLERRPNALNSWATSMTTSSSITSMVSIATGSEGMKEQRSLARVALKDRRRKAKRLKEMPMG
ncbi:hypothetical protein P691DRAFT_727545 [Macrolepiota fuliginosa MF-IS2]|uniref:Uncharacterized protein n=1 Tax=Macrolepiota fuliginosa MF-IS2 TaxID=1400762 RepID=A0A9P5XI86_9AGAR|nr:hypothetical protein P691DRAFT_727545 [Macrolepiota fuliginosa MF-IS2]